MQWARRVIGQEMVFSIVGSATVKISSFGSGQILGVKIRTPHDCPMQDSPIWRVRTVTRELPTSKNHVCPEQIGMRRKSGLMTDDVLSDELGNETGINRSLQGLGCKEKN
jgi:hypothetical protein